MTTILGICASPFKTGNTATKLKIAMEAIEGKDRKVRLEMIYLPNDFPRHDGRRDELTYPLTKRIAMLPAQGGLRVLVRKILSADGILCATPARGFGAEPRMMDLFNWLFTATDYPEYPLRNKVASFLTAFEEDGGQASNAQMWSSAAHLGFIACPFPHYHHKYASQSEGDWQNARLPLIGIEMLEIVKATQHLRGKK